MKTRTVVVGLLLAFLLFTPQGHFVAELALLSAMEGAKPAPDPVKVAAEDTARTACVVEQKAAWQKAVERAKRDHMPGFEYFDPEAHAHC
jgi:hypothetical protein